VKEFAWSHMAGWYAELGPEAFYSHLWKNADVAAELTKRLKETSAWRIAETLAR
jgi:acetyl-CoA carboxylase alpha subunit